MVATARAVMLTVTGGKGHSFRPALAGDGGQRPRRVAETVGRLTSTRTVEQEQPAVKFVRRGLTRRRPRPGGAPTRDAGTPRPVAVRAGGRPPARGGGASGLGRGQPHAAG